MKTYSQIFKFALTILVLATQLPINGHASEASTNNLQVPKTTGRTETAEHGGASTGGGEPYSQEFQAIVRSLPSLLKTKGLQYFPEVDIIKLEAKINSKISIEISTNIKVNNVSKAAQFDKNQNLVKIDPVNWVELGKVGFITPGKQALSFHEILGLMSIESNDDYHVSSRLLSLDYLAMNGLRGTSNQILPTSFDDRQVIYWQVTTDGLYTFFYCKDRNMISTCLMLGDRSYTAVELKTAMENYNKFLASEVKNAQSKRDKISTRLASIYGGLGGTVALCFVIPGCQPIGVIGGTLAVATLPAVYFTTLDPAENKLAKAKSNEELGNKIASTAELKSQKTELDLAEYAAHLHAFLGNIVGTNMSSAK